MGRTVKCRARVSYTNSIDHYSISSMCTFLTSLFNIVGVISSTWTVIRLPAATLLYAAMFPGPWGASNSAPNGCLSWVMTCRAHVCVSVGGCRDATVWVEPLNDCPKWAMSHTACVCGVDNVTPKGQGNNGNLPIKEDWSSVFSLGIIFATLPTGCRLRRK